MCKVFKTQICTDLSALIAKEKGRILDMWEDVGDTHT